MTSERDPEAVDIEIEIRREHQPILHGTQPCPSGGCCSCGAIGGCSTGLALRFLDEERAALAAADPGFTHAEFCRFVQESKDQRERAEKAESSLAAYRSARSRCDD